MKVSRAIKVLDASMDTFDGCSKKDEQQAKRLGIEALKREQAHRQGGVIYSPYLLPGETPEAK